MAEIYRVEHVADSRLQNSANPLDQLILAFLDRFVLEQDFASLEDITVALGAWSDYSTQNGATGEINRNLEVAIVGDETVISAGISDGGELVIAAIKLLANP